MSKPSTIKFRDRGDPTQAFRADRIGNRFFVSVDEGIAFVDPKCARLSPADVRKLRDWLDAELKEIGK